MRVTEKLYVVYDPETALYLKSDGPVLFTNKLANAGLFEKREEAEAASDNTGLKVLALSVGHEDISGGVEEAVPGYEQMELFGGS